VTTFCVCNSRAIFYIMSICCTYWCLCCHVFFTCIV